MELTRPSVAYLAEAISRNLSGYDVDMIVEKIEVDPELASGTPTSSRIEARCYSLIEASDLLHFQR